MSGYWKLAGITALVATVSLTGTYQLGKYHQRQQVAVDAAQSITKAMQSRTGINEKINDMDSVRLCLELGGVRADCEQLRRLATDPP